MPKSFSDTWHSTHMSPFSDLHTFCEPQALRSVICSVLRLELYQPANCKRISGSLAAHTTLGAGFLCTEHTQLSRETPPPLYSKETNHPSRSDLSPSPPQGSSYQQPSPFQPGTSCLQVEGWGNASSVFCPLTTTWREGNRCPALTMRKLEGII